MKIAASIVGLQQVKRPIFGLSRNPFVRNVAIVASGTAAAQIIGFAFAPLVTRLYEPDSFGALGVFLAIAAMVTSTAALSYPIAIVLPKDDAEALGIVRLSLMIAAATTMITTLFLLGFKDTIVQILNIDAISSFIFLIPVFMFCRACLAIMDQWVIRKKLFKVKAKVTVAQAFLLNSAKVSIGLVNPVAAVLVVLTVIGALFHAVMLVIGVRKASGGAQRRTLVVAPIMALAKRYRDFPLYRAPGQLLNAVTHGLPVLMISSFYGPASAGFYALGVGVLGMPSALIAKSVGDVFYPKINEAAHRKENLTIMIFKATLGLFLVGVVPFLTVVGFGPFLFSFVFGSDWAVSGDYARWLALWFFFGFLNKPSVVALPVLSAQRLHLIFSCFSILARAVVLSLSYYYYKNALVSVALFSIIGVILNIILILLVRQLSSAYDLSRSVSQQR